MRETVTIRRLGPGDEKVVAALATRTPRSELLADERTLFLVAFEAGEPIGFVLAYDLPRRHGDESILFVYEVDVSEEHRGLGIATGLLRELRLIAEARGIGEGFVLTEPDNQPANRLYRSAGGEGREVVEWDFRYVDV